MNEEKPGIIRCVNVHERRKYSDDDYNRLLVLVSGNSTKRKMD